VTAPQKEFDLRSIRLALAIAEHPSLRQTAAAQGISEASLSQRLRTLEDVLTVSLFHRSPNGLTPTHAGNAFFAEAREALAILDLAAMRAQAASRGETGRLCVGLFTSLSHGYLRDAVAMLQGSQPDVVLQIVEGARAALAEGIRARAIDIAILVGPPDPGLGEALSLWEERLHIALPAGHRFSTRPALRWEDLRNEMFLVSTRDAGPDQHLTIITNLRGIGTVPTTQTHSVSRHTMYQMISMGLGIALVMDSDLTNVPNGVAIVPLHDEDGETRAPFSAYRDPNNDNPALRRFWSELKKRYGDS
jgi:DNA-binding transcriptional LysR family regulator